MSALERADLQNSARDSLSSQNDQRGAGNVLRPFCEELRVDGELKLSRENFIQSIDDFFRHKAITPLSQLTATPPFPTPHVLAQFAYKAYEDYKAGETDAQYEKRVDLPDGWKLLTTASNNSWNNGYFGAAYWHPEYQQVVIAHRGTKLTNCGALWADLFGVVFKHHVVQMSSASTFTHKVVELLREVKREHQVTFQLFFTGHSLGGWLAQVTTFTTEYLKREETLFLKSYDNDCYHPHTVVFDSPGCKDMLLQMTEKLDVRLDGSSIAIDHLDITSYLSAPNRINTCNAHVGTVYRIFTDLSDMGCWYNLATHSMDKIVEAFDPETGQVYKDEQNQLKVQVVVDWPVSTGLKHSEEYKRFFEWANHFNNYHPDIKDASYLLLQCNTIRYQTKVYDERVNSFRVFSEEEQTFLQCYRWLRQWPEFFKPKELFSEMEDNEVQEQAVNILKGFEIEKDKIRCTDASALQAVIPYVKRLLQLFPEIKEKTNRALSSDEVRRRVYQIETRRYIERVSQSPLEFNSNASRFRESIESFREFLDSQQQKVLNLRMVKGDEWTGLTKVYQVLQKTGCLIKGQYTVLKLDRLLTLNQFMDLSKLMQSAVTPHLLMIACDDIQQLDEEIKEVIRSLFDTLTQTPDIKIIFITRSEGSTVDFLNHMSRRISGRGFVRRDEQLTWSDLIASSQTKLLEKSVKFQGAKISLNQLMSAESPAASFLNLGALLEEKELTIADPVSISNGYNESYYTGRTFRHQIAVKQDIFDDNDVRDSRVYLDRTEEEYTELCQLHPTSNVHWVEKGMSGKLVWQQSQGSLETVRRYIDTESSHKYTPDNLDKLLEQAQHQRVMLISDTAGMGKSTVLTHLSKEIKQNFPAKWVVRIDLNDHTDALNALKKEQIDKERAIEFVSKKLLKLKPDLEVELFKQCCEQKQMVKIVLMLDGFDEISPFYEKTVIDLLQALRQTAVEQLWVTTRPHLRKQLEDKLQQLSYRMEPFSEENQVDFLTKYWSLKFWFTEGNRIVEGEGKEKLQIFAKELINKLGNSISDQDRQFTGIPLQTRLLAEGFDTEVKMFYQSAESMPDLQFQLDLVGLYGRFIERKYDIYQEEKCQVPVNNVRIKEQRESDVKILREDHQLLALKVMFTEEQVTKIQNNTECKFSAEKLTSIGIVQVSPDGTPHFIHRTFAEYYVADCLVSRLTEGNNTSEQVLEFILEDVLLKEDYRVVRVFIDGLLSESKPSEEVLKEYGNLINGLWIDSQLDDENDDDLHYDYDCDCYWDCDYHNYGDIDYDNGDDYGDLYNRWCNYLPLLDKAVSEANANIMGFLLDSAQAAENADILKKMLLEKDRMGRTVWHKAVFSHNIQVLEKLWECATSHELRRELLFAEDHKGRNPSHLAVWNGKLEVLLKQCELVKREFNNRRCK